MAFHSNADYESVRGWELIGIVDFPSLTSTTKTTNEDFTVDGITFRTEGIAGGEGNLSFGGGSNLVRSINTGSFQISIMINLTWGVDLTNARNVAAVIEGNDTGTQTAVVFGQDWNNCFAHVRTNTTQTQVQRRDNGTIDWQYNTIAEGSSALCVQGQAGTTSWYKRTDGPFTDPPHPTSFSTLVGQRTRPIGSLTNQWPFLTAAGSRLQFWWNGGDSSTNSIKRASIYYIPTET